MSLSKGWLKDGKYIQNSKDKEMLKFVRYGFDGWTRLPIWQFDAEVFRLSGIWRSAGRFYAPSPEAGGESVAAKVVERVSLQDLLATGGKIYAADAYLADRVITDFDSLERRCRDHGPRWGLEATAQIRAEWLAKIDKVVDSYVATMRVVRTEDDVPEFWHERTVFCPCGCGAVERESRFNYLEVFVIVPWDDDEDSEEEETEEI